VQDLLVPANHHLERPEGVALGDAAAEEWIVKKENNDTYALLVAACLAAGFAPRITHQVKEWYAVSARVAEGFGVCLLPRMVPIPASHAVVRVPLRGGPLPTRKIVTCVRRGSAGHPDIAAGLAALDDVAGVLRSLPDA
jgi:DNA-binding transcriptional LysR family regulator